MTSAIPLPECFVVSFLATLREKLVPEDAGNAVRVFPAAGLRPVEAPHSAPAAVRADAGVAA
jgi:hypothetical protein